MPLGFERVNVRQNVPNERIVFIKPLDGPDKEIALDFLQRVAAICTPIMKKNYLSVLSLEEFKPNSEFVGRNFNAGEVIQLVLKSPTTGRWLPFHYVQMVMMHELAHCKQMNHSRAFWKVRNIYAEELRELWAKNYSGDGLWGRGQSLYSGQYTSDAIPDLKDLPEHLCGGTYRSSRRKRKRKPQTQKSNLSYAERKQRRIAKKFGLHGTALGGDEDIKSLLEKGKKVKGNPRVAKSARGRELRAAAALARFEQSNAKDSQTEDGAESDTDGDSDFEDAHIKEEDALDLDGHRLLDSQGQGMVKICEDEDIVDDADAQRELLELGHIAAPKKSPHAAILTHSSKDQVKSEADQNGQRHKLLTKQVEQSTPKETFPPTRLNESKSEQSPKQNTSKSRNLDESKVTGIEGGAMRRSESDKPYISKRLDSRSANVCNICSLENEPQAYVCIACSNVLDTNSIPNHWRCQSETCKHITYINHGDNAICGLCGHPKPSEKKN